MVYCGDVHFKQRAGTEYLVEEKKPVSNMHTLEVYSVNAVKKIVSRVYWLARLVLGKSKRSSVKVVAHAGQQQQSLRRRFNVLMNSTH